ncbi:MAG: T9SS type A sorting domain-containing protein, partial [Bacteroidota bacterium]
SSVELAPLHLYAAPGEYEVNLLAYTGSDTTRVTETITISDVVLFIELLVPDTAFLGIPTDFSFRSTGQIAHVFWYINNGQLATDEFSTSFTYQELGTFNYTFEAYATNGCPYLKWKEITVVMPVHTDELLAHNHLAIYPNPSDGLFNLEIDLVEEQDLEIQVYNTLGAALLKQTLATTRKVRQSLDLSKWPSGIYFLEMSSGAAYLRRLLVKQ